MGYMKDQRNRLASRQGKYEWGWLQNKEKTSSTEFGFVCADGSGSSGWSSATSDVLGVCPVFQISLRKDK